ncbi:MAG: DUF805 domain-containing protein [Betaproteobacteria bacterium]|jgi:uncharacterized membrane protein YhaH (DUF805 family)
MTLTESLQTCLRKYTDFSGRASRSEFWWWTLSLLLLLGGTSQMGTVPACVAFLGTLLPDLAVKSRRLHDTGRRGWWQLIVMVPLVGPLILLYWCAQKSAGENRFG